MIHVLLIHQAFVPSNGAGGTRHYELAKYCVKRKCRFTVVAGSISYLTGERTKQNDDERGIQITQAFTYPSLHKGFVFRILAFISFMFSSTWEGITCKQPDVVMGTSPPIFQAFSAWLVSVFRNKPFLLEIRDLWPEFAIDLGVLKNRILIQLSRGLEAFLYRRSDLILVNSPAYRDYLLNHGTIDKKIKFVPNGVDSSMFESSGNESILRGKYQLQGKKLMIYTGALGMANDIYTLLDAMKLLKKETRIHLVLAGDGMEKKPLERYAIHHGLNNVTFTGALPKSSIPIVLAESDACVAILKNIPMFKTTYPNKVFDYMAAGKPTILAIDGVIREVIEESKGGIYSTPGDALQLAENIKLVLNNPIKARKMGISAKKYVTRHFNRANQADEFYQILNELSGKRN